jgi:serine/threonine protein kinase
MSLVAGTRLGPYEILAAPGAGGMGEVYRARDTRLDRDVAIKLGFQVAVDDPALVDGAEPVGDLARVVEGLADRLGLSGVTRCP